jgi:hypothetical protein
MHPTKLTETAEIRLPADMGVTHVICSDDPDRVRSPGTTLLSIITQIKTHATTYSYISFVKLRLPSASRCLGNQFEHWHRVSAFHGMCCSADDDTFQPRTFFALQETSTNSTQR